MALSAKLRRLSALAQDLNQATTGLNEAIDQLDDQLSRMGIGLRHWLPEIFCSVIESPHPPGGTGRGWKMGFDKVESRWGLAAKEISWRSGFFEGDTDCPWENEADVGAPRQLRNAPRQVRIEAARHLDDLVDALVGEIETAIEAVDAVPAVAAPPERPARDAFVQAVRRRVESEPDHGT